MQSNVMKKSQVMVALDFASEAEALELVAQLEQFTPYLKIGMQMFYLAGPQLIYKLKERGFPIFLDLKLHDIPNTVKGASRSLTGLGVDIFNVHCAGGSRMLEAALEGVEESLSPGIKAPKVIGVTHLTSTSQDMLNHQIGIEGELDAAILHYATLAWKSGLHGVVCSPLEVQMIKARCGAQFLTVTPGIRPESTNLDDQVRVTTPQEAASLGTDFMVIGRAITKSDDPAAAYHRIMTELEMGEK